MPNDSTDTGDDVRTFVDTNVLVYAHDGADPVQAGGRSDRARAPLGQRHGHAQHAGAPGVPRRRDPETPTTDDPGRRARGHRAYSAWQVVLIEPAIILGASHVSERHRLSFWDALMVEAARVGGAGWLLTEDLQDGQVIEGVVIVDPFRAERTATPG